ncbi:MAG TPA: ATP-binding protein [Longimicrobiales bacterium]
MIHHPESNGALRQQTLARRLFGWLLALLLVPTLVLIAAALLVGSRSVELFGTLGAWDEVAESGRIVFEAAEPAARRDTALASALREHQRNLSGSLTQARRWAFIGARLSRALPGLALLFALLLVAFSLWISRRIARDLARPIEEIVGWADRLGRGEPLPESRAGAGEVMEVRALRSALRNASERIAEGRVRALETERVRAWGEMARRIAHEMKNPLTPLRLAVHRMAGAAEASPQLAEPMEVIAQETARLDELARQFAVLGRPSAGPRSDVDVRELLEHLLATDVPPDISTSVDAPLDVPLVLAHYDALQRAFRNLIRNAVEAIAARREQDGKAPRWIRVSITSATDALVIRVADSGGGMPEDQLLRIFEPDYTLKAGGTGLGLALVRQAIIAHNGTVAARNEADGAVFDVVLPEGRS